MKANTYSQKGTFILKMTLCLIPIFLSNQFVIYGQVGQNFEGITARDLQDACLYVDPSTATHVLQNYNSAPCGGVITVKSASSGAVLGFENLFTLDGTSQTEIMGFTEGDAFGVANNSSLQFQLGVNAQQGSNAFLMEDIDGDVFMRFDQVDLTGTTNPQVNLYYILASTTWEAEDFLKIDVEITNCSAATTFNLLNISGAGIDAVEGSWRLVNGNLTPYIGCAARLIIGHSSNASAEEMAIDNINFTQGVIGTPPPPLVCPTISTNSISSSSVCLNEPFNITATGLNNMNSAANNVGNFGIKFVAHAIPTATPYNGGIDLGTVPFGSLTAGGTTASFVGAELGMTGTFQVYAILDPIPIDGSCRPSASTSVTVNGCPVSCNPVTGVRTSFETIVAQNLGGTCTYFDADNVSIHEIQNYTAACGPITVNYAGFGTTLGFKNILDPINTAQSPKEGFSDGDAFGVANNTSLNSNIGASAPNGSQAFLMEDIDGNIAMKFDMIDLTGTTSPFVNFQYYLSSTSWEAADFFSSRVEITGCGAATSISLIDISGTAMDAVEGNWNTLSTDLTPYIGCMAELVIEFSSDATTERLAIDNVNFTQGCRAGSAPAIVCPTMGPSTASESSVCLNSPFNLNLNGLTNMNAAGNTDQDYGIRYVAFPSATSTPYVGGTTLGIVPFASLTNGNSTANFTGAMLGMTGTFQVYAVLSPTPLDGSCRPSSVTSITITGCRVPCTGSIGTSFETIVPQNLQGTCVYIDPDNSTIHELQNTNPSCGPITVNYASFGNTLGFKNIFDPINTAQTPVLGFSDGDAFGVANNTSLNFNLGASAPDGSQAFLMEDIDGDVAMIFDEVSLTESSSPTVSLQYFISTSTWENSDFFRSRVEITSCPAATSVSLINVSGTGMDALEGSWRTLNANLTDYAGCTAQLIVEFSSNTDAEELGIDNVVFTNGCIVYPIICPTIGSITPSSSSVCVNNTFDLAAAGLATMEGANNNEQDFGIEFKYFTDETTDPYTGGTSLGTVAYANLTGGNSTASLTEVSIANADPTGFIYAILSPAPTTVTCRPFAMTSFAINPLPSTSFTALTDLCVNAGVQTGLGGGTATGGVYSGNGVTDDGNGMTYSFDPASAGVGVHTITYTLTDVNGCSSSASDDVEVFALPVVAFTAPVDLCINAGLQTGLGGGTATGGVYSGNGVTDDGNGMTYSFDPASAGVGVHTITYTLTDVNGCSNSATDDIEVLSLDNALFNFNSVAYCNTNSNPIPIITGLAGGIFSSTSGLDINSSTGEINLLNSSPENYTITYSTSGICPNSSSVDIGINEPIFDTVTPSEFNDVYGCEGKPLKIGVNISTNIGLTYQWQVNNGGVFQNLTNTAPYSNVTADSLVVNPMGLLLHNNQYRLLVSNACQINAVSDTLTLKVGQLPILVNSPLTQEVCSGNEVVLEAEFTGAGFYYQWQVDEGSGFANVFGSGYTLIGNKLIISNFDNAKNNNQYRVLAKSSCFEVPSNAATITINTDITILAQPTSQSVCEFGTAIFTAQAIKLTAGTLNYQWQRKSGTNWVNVNTGGRYMVTGNQLQITNAPASWNGIEFRCLMNDYCQTIPKTLNVIPVAHVTANPQNVEICQGNNANFIITAVGQGLTYRWQVNTGSGFTNLVDGGVYQGATSANLSLSFPTSALNGFQYRCIVSGTSTCDVVGDTSAVAILSIGVSAEAQTIFYNSAISTDDGVTQAVGYILGVNNILAPNGKAEFRAGNAILLNPGFEVEVGAVFRAVIRNPCATTSFESSTSGEENKIPKEKIK